MVLKFVMDTMTDALSTPTATLHECVALGQIELGLSSGRDPTSTTAYHHEGDRDEVDRLPLLVRWLFSARPRARIPGTASSQDEERDPLTDEVVGCLEDRAAMHSEAEHVERLVGHLVPSVCKAFLNRNNKKTRREKNKNKNKTSRNPMHTDDKVRGGEDDERTEDDEDDNTSAHSGDSMELEPSGYDGETYAEDDSRAIPSVLHELVNEKTISDDSLLFQSEGRAVLAALMHHVPTLKHKEVAVRFVL